MNERYFGHEPSGGAAVPSGIGASRQGRIGAPYRARLAPAAAPRGHRRADVRRGAQQARLLRHRWRAAGLSLSARRLALAPAPCPARRGARMARRIRARTSAALARITLDRRSASA